MREALRALDTLVVIDVAMSETAQLADYVLPASSQFEKAEATFFNFEFPKNYFHLRPRLFEPVAGTLPEAEIHARLCEALGAITDEDLAPLREAAAAGREAYGQAFMATIMTDPRLSHQAPVLLYRTLGPTLPEGLREGAVLFGLAFRYAMQFGPLLERAGFTGHPGQVAASLFQAILDSPSGLVFAIDEWSAVMGRVGTSDGKIHLALDDLLAEVDGLKDGGADLEGDFPFVLSAGERRSFTANTIIRDPSWRSKDAEGALRMSPADAARLGVANGERVRVVTRRGAAEVDVSVTDTMQAGHLSLPNGLGVDYPDGSRVGVAPNELTRVEDRDPFVGTPWHKFVPARVEPIAAAE